MKNYLLLTVFIFSGCNTFAQTDTLSDTRKFIFEFGGSVGVFLPVSLEKEKIENASKYTGSNAVTYLQLTYKSNYFAKVQYGQSSVAYKSQVASAGSMLGIDSKVNTNNIGINFGYQRTFGRWQPYVIGGGGIALVDVPTVSYDMQASQNVFSTKSKSFTTITIGTGVNYKVGKYFVPFIEGQLSALPNPSRSSLTHLSGVSMLIGIKASLF